MNVKSAAVLLAFAGAFMAGCSSTPKTAPPVAAAPAAMAPTPQQAAAPTPSVAAPATEKAVVGSGLPAYLDPSSPIYKERSAYFDFDSATVKSEALGMVELHGQYLASHPALSIRIEGNTDERGGSEYNLALGQKRAESVLHALQVYGVKEASMQAVSWGKEKPRAAGHDESDWAQNRRADLVYPTK